MREFASRKHLSQENNHEFICGCTIVHEHFEEIFHQKAPKYGRSLIVLNSYRKTTTSLPVVVYIPRLVFLERVDGATEYNLNNISSMTKKYALQDLNAIHLNHIIKQLISLIDERINRQINCIIHHPRFQRLEASWRGIFLLVSTSYQHHRVIIRFLDMSYRELEKDLMQSVEFDQSQAFRKIYSSEFDQSGGEPYGLIIGDYYFTHKSEVGVCDGVGVLERMAKIASAAFAPYITSVAPSFFGLDSLTEIQTPFQLDDIFRLSEYDRWKRLRQDDDARYVGLVLPKVLMRQPYNSYGIQASNRFFKERVLCHDDYLWGNASYHYAAVVIRSFIETGWLADIHGLESAETEDQSLLVRNCFQADIEKVFPKFSIEYGITDYQEKIFSDAGFIALRDHGLKRKAVFYSSHSIQVSAHYSTQGGNANAKISTLLPYLFCVSRFTHYIKVMMRDKLGQFINSNDTESYLNGWLRNYCASSQGLSPEAKARYPLNEAKVVLTEQRGLPGKYFCTIYLKPHHQLDHIQSHLKLITQVKEI